MAEEKIVEEPVKEGSTEAAPVVSVEEKRPDFLDARFKTVEDQAKAYRDAEIKMQHEANRRVNLERELMMRQQEPPKAPKPAEPEENLDELYWQKPAYVQKKLIEEAVDRRLGSVEKKFEPFIEDRFNSQKSKYASDETFKQLEPQIDEVFRQQPQLKNQPGSVDYVYNFLKAQNFNPEIERTRIREEERAKLMGANKQAGQVEGTGSPGAGPTTTPKIELTEDERRTATKFYPELPPQEAHKRYAESKVKWSKGA